MPFTRERIRRNFHGAFYAQGGKYYLKPNRVLCGAPRCWPNFVQRTAELHSIYVTATAEMHAISDRTSFQLLGWVQIFLNHSVFWVCLRKIVSSTWTWRLFVFLQWQHRYRFGRTVSSKISWYKTEQSDVLYRIITADFPAAISETSV